MSFENIIIEKQNNIAVITINRPSQLNALNKLTIHELNHALHELNEEAETRVVVITGTGDKSFVAGADIKEFSEFSNSEGAELARLGQEKLFNFIEKYEKAKIYGFVQKFDYFVSIIFHNFCILFSKELKISGAFPARHVKESFFHRFDYENTNFPARDIHSIYQLDFLFDDCKQNNKYRMDIFQD